MSTVARIQIDRLLTLGAMILALLPTNACTSASGAASVSRAGASSRARDRSDRNQSYRALLREAIETSIGAEAGVLTLYAVAVKGRPEHIRIVEMYADQTAYEAHVQTPHFLKYKAGTQSMVKSLTLLETDPVLLAANPEGSSAVRAGARRV